MLGRLLTRLVLITYMIMFLVDRLLIEVPSNIYIATRSVAMIIFVLGILYRYLWMKEKGQLD